MHRPLGRQSAGIPLRRGRSGTKTRFEIHTGWCRARRKRKRLTSNGSIESDAAVPVTFQRKFLLRKLWDKQQELVRAIRNHNQVAVKGCHGSGKTYACAGMVPYELTAHQESIVLVTAPTLRQVKTFWREITEAITTSQIRYPEPTP
jgi:primosomal protein N'